MDKCINVETSYANGSLGCEQFKGWMFSTTILCFCASFMILFILWRRVQGMDVILVLTPGVVLKYKFDVSQSIWLHPPGEYFQL